MPGVVRNAIAQLNSDLGSKSSASAVTGNDAFSKIATLNDNKISKSGDTMAGGLIFNNNSNDTPEVLFKSKDYGYVHLDYYNGAFRILNSVDAAKNVQIG
jgi:hypothetical protein